MMMHIYLNFMIKASLHRPYGTSFFTPVFVCYHNTVPLALGELAVPIAIGMACSE